MSAQPVDYLTTIDNPPDLETEDDLPELSRWLDGLVQQMNDVIFKHGYVLNQLGVGLIPYAQFTKLLAAPVDPQIGWVAYADGTSWNPGAGEGLYVWKSDLAWHKIT